MYRILCAYSFSRAMYEYIMYKQNKFDDFGEHLGIGIAKLNFT